MRPFDELSLLRQHRGGHEQTDASNLRAEVRFLRGPDTLMSVLDSIRCEWGDRRDRSPAALADLASNLRPVRYVFTAYVLLIALGLGFYIAIGITNHQ